jgi:serine/threonine protein kinase
MFIDIIKALLYIHTEFGGVKQICHYDLKPSNLLLTPDDNGKYELKLIDFGFSS